MQFRGFEQPDGVREWIVAMDRRAVEVMARVHPERDRVAKMRAALDRRRTAREAPKPRESLITRAIKAEQERRAAAQPETTPDPTLSPGFRALAIAERVAARSGFTVAQLRGPSRKRKLAHCRHAAMFEIAGALKPEEFSIPQIGRLFGGRDHTTVLWAIQAHSNRTGLPTPRGISRVRSHGPKGEPLYRVRAA